MQVLVLTPTRELAKQVRVLKLAKIQRQPFIVHCIECYKLMIHVPKELWILCFKTSQIADEFEYLKSDVAMQCLYGGVPYGPQGIRVLVIVIEQPSFFDLHFTSQFV